MKLPKSVGQTGSLTATVDFVPPRSVPSSETHWQRSMKNAFRSSAELSQWLGLPTETGSANDAGFPVFVPREFAAKMNHGDPLDPLLRQVIADPKETLARAGFSSDPVGDSHANVAPGVLHKYDGRALLITTAACGVHCRYCFRREFPYSDHRAMANGFAEAINYLESQPTIEEVLLSGGDPLTLTDEVLARLLVRIESVEHVRRLRIHTRMPIVIPSRVTDALIAMLHNSRLTVWVVVHANHPAEIDQETALGLSRLVDAGIPVLNQSVLLSGVNDDVETLAELSRRLIDQRVMPYYLHQLDRVNGAGHFEVSDERARELIDQLESRLPGYAVPRLVREIAGKQSKTRI